MKVRKYPKIGQFHQAIKAVREKTFFAGLNDDGSVIYDTNRELPSLSYVGTVKLHGTNASLVFLPSGEIFPQSRNRVLSITSDNAGFAAFVNAVGRPVWDNFLSSLKRELKLGDDKNIIVYGEWCGEGIQRGVGISALSRRFVLFSIKTTSGEGLAERGEWHNIEELSLDEFEKDGLYTVYSTAVPSFRLDIDFNFDKLEASSIKLEGITREVERECPFSLAFGVREGVGEGVVWHCTTEGFKSSDFWFKVKGEKHNATKVKKLAHPDPEKAASINDFAGKVTTVSRMRQGIEYLNDNNLAMENSSTGHFVKWVVNDAVNEELDMLSTSGLGGKDVARSISGIASKWFLEFLNAA